MKMRMRVVKNSMAVCIALCMVAIAVYSSAQENHRGAKIIDRDMTELSIHEGPSGERDAGVKQNINPIIGQVPASYIPTRSFIGAIGSFVRPFFADPTLLGSKTGQRSRLFSRTGRTDRLFDGIKELGGTNVTDEAQLGNPGGRNPGDPYWVAFPRAGNIEIPPLFQRVHEPWDCFCRYGEIISCPIPGHQFQHREYGGWLFPWNNIQIPCQACFGIDRIRKHDFYVGVDRGPHSGYPRSFPGDPGYQECLRQSIESFAASGGGGPVQGEPELYGL